MRGDEAQSELGARAEGLVKLARAELGTMSARHRAEGFLKLNAQWSAAPRHDRRLLAVPIVLAIAVLALVVRHGWGLREERALSYTLVGGGIDATGAARAAEKEQPRLRFSDGTEVVFAPGARGRVKSVSEHGARISLSGRADVAVVPHRGSLWFIDAGPFVIRVTGTAFTAEWQEAEGRLEIALRKGSVSVTGPLSDEAIELRAGQRLVVSTRSKEVRIRGIDSVERSNVAVSAPPPQPVHDRPAAVPSATAAPSAANPATASWATELAAGRFATILRQAEERGLDTAIAQVSSDELAALSDAARYSRRDDVARRALAAQRHRFPGSRRANDAAFLLGRLEETAQHSELALGWYDRCLNESPSGTYTSEALGRKMTLVHRLHGAARARPIAAEYLRRFSHGTYAAAARALERLP